MEEEPKEHLRLVLKKLRANQLYAKIQQVLFLANASCFPWACYLC
jgi:hypothetical protein